MNHRPSEFLAWAADMFGPIALDRRERMARFLEEAIELAQADGMMPDIIEKIVQRVYSRPPGPINKEVGQVQATLELYAQVMGISANAEAAREFNRVQMIPRDEWERRHAAKVALGIAS